MSRQMPLVVMIPLLLTCYILYLRSSLPEWLQPLSPDFSRFDNVSGSPRFLVPNLVHYVQFDQKCINFVTFVCMLSTWYNHRPSTLYIHANEDLETGECRYIRLLRQLLGPSLQIQRTIKPTHVFSKKIGPIQHASDVARIKVLMEYGGIYLDQDVYVVQSLNRFRHFECSLGWPEDAFIGNQVILAHREARFLKLYLELYRNYHSSKWYYNAGESPTKNILWHWPHLVHRARTEFGVEMLVPHLYWEQWTGYKERYTMHLLASHGYLHNTSLEENTFRRCNCTFTTLANHVLNHLEEDLKDFKIAPQEP